MATNGKHEKDALGTRMKAYELTTRTFLPRRSYTIIRIDGKAFHTYTRDLVRPFDLGLIEDMNATAAYLCKNIMGAKFAYVQSDEISILLTDFEDIGTQAWFENNVQKMVSVAASMATAKFNQLRFARDAKAGGDLVASQILGTPLAEFDARVYQIPQKVEVENYFIWRQQDATRNSISSVAQSLYSHKELHGVSSDQKQELIFQKGINWNNYPSRMKRGGFIGKVSELWRKPKGTKKAGEPVPQDELKDIELMIGLHGLSYDPNFEFYRRTRWEDIECPIFTQDRAFLNTKIPNNQ
jgi:tRNA(His) 5'-end guanylyltransferase